MSHIPEQSIVIDLSEILSVQSIYELVEVTLNAGVTIDATISQKLKWTQNTRVVEPSIVDTSKIKITGNDIRTYIVGLDPVGGAGSIKLHDQTKFTGIEETISSINTI